MAPRVALLLAAAIMRLGPDILQATKHRAGSSGATAASGAGAQYDSKGLCPCLEARLRGGRWPRPIIIPQLMTPTTLADVRRLIRHLPDTLPTGSRARHTRRALRRALFEYDSRDIRSGIPSRSTRNGRRVAKTGGYNSALSNDASRPAQLPSFKPPVTTQL